jgi:hypothetical protein
VRSRRIHALFVCSALAACTASVDSYQNGSPGEGSEGSGEGSGSDEGDVGDQEPLTPPDEGDTPAPPPTAPSGLATGSYARVCNATALNQRSAPSTSATVLKVLPEGSSVIILDRSDGWYKNDWNGNIGWSSGTYLCPAAPPSQTTGDGFASTVVSPASFLSIAQAAVGFSYYYGGGNFAAGGNPGTCTGTCPSCSHSGAYGADCSGFVAKAWLLPEALPMDSNRHPYTSTQFTVTSASWSTISRSSMQAGDALATSGHVMLYEKDDPWGSFWAFEARGCSYGVVHNIRTAGSGFVAVRRRGI